MDTSKQRGEEERERRRTFAERRVNSKNKKKWNIVTELPKGTKEKKKKKFYDFCHMIHNLFFHNNNNNKDDDAMVCNGYEDFMQM